MGLTPAQSRSRDLEMLGLLSNGKTIREIALIIGYSEMHTYDEFLRLRREFGAKTNPHLVALVIRENLIG